MKKIFQRQSNVFGAPFIFPQLKPEQSKTVHELVLCGSANRGTGPGGGGVTLKFSVYIGEADFLGVKILNFRIFLGFQKN